MAVSFYGPADPTYLGFAPFDLPSSFFTSSTATSEAPQTRAPTPSTFYWAISANVLNGFTHEFKLADQGLIKGRVAQNVLSRTDSCAVVGSSIFVFKVSNSSSASPPTATIVPVSKLANCLREHVEDDCIDASP